jgi:hypothetical protein
MPFYFKRLVIVCLLPGNEAVLVNNLGTLLAEELVELHRVHQLSPQNENLNLLIRIKFLNLFLYVSK